MNALDLTYINQRSRFSNLWWLSYSDNHYNFLHSIIIFLHVQKKRFLSALLMESKVQTISRLIRRSFQLARIRCLNETRCCGITLKIFDDTFRTLLKKTDPCLPTTHCLTKSNSLSIHSSKNPIRTDSSPD